MWPNGQLLWFWSVKPPRPESFFKRRIIKNQIGFFFFLVYCAGFGQDDKYLARFPSVLRNLFQISVECWLQHPNREKGKPVTISLFLFQSLYNLSKGKQLLKADLSPPRLFQRGRYRIQRVDYSWWRMFGMPSAKYCQYISVNPASAFVPKAINTEFCFIC